MKRSFTILDGFFLLVLIGLTVAFFSVIRPFLISIFVAAIVASVCYRPYQSIAARLGNRRHLTAALAVTALLVAIAVPLLLAGLMVYTEIAGGYEYIRQNWPELSERLQEVELFAAIEDIPIVSQALSQLDFGTIQLDEVLRNALSLSADFLVAATQASFANIASAILNFFIFLVLFFFLLVDGEALLRRVRALIPLSSGEVDRISGSAQDIITATLLTNFGLGIVEGSIGALYFSLFGLPSPFLWGMVMVLFSIIPMIGANFVMLPAGILLIVTGSPIRGLALMALSTATVAITQNVVRPWILGDRSGLHPALVLMSTLGGIALLGLIGFLVGPLLAALFVVIWTEFGTRFQPELATRDGAALNAGPGSPGTRRSVTGGEKIGRRRLRAGPTGRQASRRRPSGR